MAGQQDVILVTGSSGLIGSAVVQRLAGRYYVIALDRQAPREPPPPDCTHIYFDVESDDSVRDGLRIVREHHGPRLVSVIHLAAYYDFSGEPSPKYEQVTVCGTERLLRGLQGFGVERFVFSSTMLVHAPCDPGQFIDENWPLEPKWDYPTSKVRTEQVIRERRGAIPALVLRIAGVYDDRTHSIPIANQIQRIYERRLVSHLFPGDTAHGQAFLHLDDLVEAFALAVERRAALPPETPVLLGEPETLSYDELQHTFGRLIWGEEWETREIPKLVAKTGAWLQDHVPGEEPFIKPWMIDRADDHYALDITRARTLLGWQPKRSLRQTLPLMVAALTADPPRWYRDNKLDPPSWLHAATAPPASERTPRP